MLRDAEQIGGSSEPIRTAGSPRLRSMAVQLEPRQKRVVIGGAAVVTALLAFLLWPSASGQGDVELVPADQRTAVSAPQPIPVVQVAPPPASPAAAPAAGVDGLVLHGVMASGAIIGFANGTQLYVPLGREVIPGLRLQAVRLHHAILATPTVNYCLGFGGTAVAISAGPVAASAGGGAVPRLIVPGAGRNAMGGPLISGAQQQQLGRQFVAGLDQRRVDNRVTGWTIRPGANLMALSQAGLQAGDVLISVNGEAVLDQEQVAGLPQQIADSHRAEFEFERNGQRMRRAIEVNPRR